jgi:hypothetical protein
LQKLKIIKQEHLPSCCSPEILEPAFKKLCNLRSIKVTLSTCLFINPPEFMQQVWAIPSTRRLPRAATRKRFTSLLTAVSSSPVISLKQLSHNRLAFEFFAQKPTLLSALERAFASLTTLILRLDHLHMTDNQETL